MMDPKDQEEHQVCPGSEDHPEDLEALEDQDPRAPEDPLDLPAKTDLMVR